MSQLSSSHIIIVIIFHSIVMTHGKSLEFQIMFKGWYIQRYNEIVSRVIYIYSTLILKL